jgi:hypothetical protein
VGVSARCIVIGDNIFKVCEEYVLFAAEDRDKGELWWKEWQLAAEQLAPFDGRKEELEVIMNYVQGKRMFLRKGARLTVCSDERAAWVSDLPWRQRGLEFLASRAPASRAP